MDAYQIQRILVKWEVVKYKKELKDAVARNDKQHERFCLGVINKLERLL